MVSPFERSLQRSLRRSFRCQRSMRVWTMLLGLCYLVLSIFLPLQHTHSVGEEETGFGEPTVAKVEQPQHAAASSVAAQVSFLRKPALSHSSKQVSSKSNAQPKPAFVKAGKSRSAHCLACEWSAMQVSVALPTFKLFLTETTPPRVVTTLPRCLRSRAIATASRGPPTV